MSDKTPVDEQTLEQLKIAKNNRIRKNLRILALCAAAYYFISAGIAFYEDSQDAKIRINPEYRTIFETNTDNAVNLAKLYDANNFATVFAQADKKSNSTIFKLNCQEGNEGSLAIDEYDGKVVSMVMSFKGEDFKDPALYQLLRYTIAVSENNVNSSIVDEILKVMGFDPNAQNPTFKDADLSSKKIRYQVATGDGGKSVKITTTILPQS